jgi:hypothetical protein
VRYAHLETGIVNEYLLQLIEAANRVRINYVRVVRVLGLAANVHYQRFAVVDTDIANLMDRVTIHAKTLNVRVKFHTV